jgi:hypothetical protein
MRIYEKSANFVKPNPKIATYIPIANGLDPHPGLYSRSD